MDDGWKDIFREDEMTKKLLKDMKETFKNSSSDLDSLKDSMQKLIYKRFEIEAVRNKVDKTNLKFGLEILRVNDKKEEILLRKYQFPLPDIKDDLVKMNYIKEININAYAGLFSIPIQTLNQSKEFLATLNDNQKESSVLYGIIAVPLKKEGSIYTISITLVTDIKIFGEIAHSCHVGIKTKIPVGEKVKIAIGTTQFLIRPGLNHITGTKDTLSMLERAIAFPITEHAESIYSDEKNNWTISRTINGQIIKFSNRDEYFTGLKDYLVLSLESD
jgi:hypothetical protein